MKIVTVLAVSSLKLSGFQARVVINEGERDRTDGLSTCPSWVQWTSAALVHFKERLKASVKWKLQEAIKG